MVLVTLDGLWVTPIDPWMLWLGLSSFRLARLRTKVSWVSCLLLECGLMQGGILGTEQKL